MYQCDMDIAMHHRAVLMSSEAQLMQFHRASQMHASGTALSDGPETTRRPFEAC